ncbi:MAG: ABC transporter ATP-binding protein, partial [Acidimicrobiales bacterium]
PWTRRRARESASAHAVQMLDSVGVSQPEVRAEQWPHQFSGGMRQRAMIAMAMTLGPELLIADEPTTALDVTVQAQVLELMQRLQADLGMAIIMITHDLGIIADMAERVLIMYAGKVMEAAARRETYYEPHHPYTCGLLRSLPQSGHEGEPLVPIAGQPPSLIRPPVGCPFSPRCAYVMPKCRVDPPPLFLLPASPEHRSACWLPLDLVGLSDQVDAARRLASATETASWTGAEGEPGLAQGARP